MSKVDHEVDLTLGMYILDGHTPVPCTDLRTWGLSFKSNDRIVARTTISGVNISTVFLGLDHSYGRNGPPILFETRIFGGPHNDYQDRCATWDEAEAMHAKAINLVKST